MWKYKDFSVQASTRGGHSSLRAGWSSPSVFELQMPRAPPEMMPLFENISRLDQLDQVQSACSGTSTDAFYHGRVTAAARSCGVIVFWISKCKADEVEHQTQQDPMSGSYFRVAAVQGHGFEEV